MKAPARSVALVGFMGAGKSTVARCLAEAWGWEVRDLDLEITRRTGRDPGAWIREEGEAAFRRQETAVLREVLGSSSSTRTVLACGGGTFCQAEARQLLLADALCVWLDVPLETALARCAEGDRPLLDGGSRMLEDLYRERRADYARAHLRIEAVDEPEETVRRVRAAAARWSEREAAS